MCIKMITEKERNAIKAWEFVREALIKTGKVKSKYLPPKIFTEVDNQQSNQTSAG